MSEDSRQKTVRVVDRRWFTADGELRDLPEEPAAGPQQAAPPPSQREPAPVADSSRDAPPTATRGSAGGAPDLSLLDLIDALARPAAALLSGQVRGHGRDLDGARYYIDLLGVLRNRIGTPLSLEESRYLDDVLYQLRSLFVAATR